MSVNRNSDNNSPVVVIEVVITIFRPGQKTIGAERKQEKEVGTNSSEYVLLSDFNTHLNS